MDGIRGGNSMDDETELVKIRLKEMLEKSIRRFKELRDYGESAMPDMFCEHALFKCEKCLLYKRMGLYCGKAKFNEITFPDFNTIIITSGKVSRINEDIYRKEKEKIAKFLDGFVEFFEKWLEDLRQISL